ncbi:hypothetical protein B0H14DRAFT_2580191 [Mycena olivaceomarginata]|nr:hypothetical protein B0H14DRAFT_2580191 [Mycena olivaceomarginata]
MQGLMFLVFQPGHSTKHIVGRSAAGKSGELGVDRMEEEADVEEIREGTGESVRVEMVRRGRLGRRDGTGLTTSTSSLPEYQRRRREEVAGSSTIMTSSSELGSGQRLDEEPWNRRVGMGVSTSDVFFFVDTGTDSERANKERLARGEGLIRSLRLEYPSRPARRVLYGSDGWGVQVV